MPLYAYRCNDCGYKFEKIQNFSATPERECPKCKGELTRPLTAPSLQFKGAGFYVNDYPGRDAAPKSEPPSCAGSGPACAACPAAAPAAAD